MEAVIAGIKSFFALGNAAAGAPGQAYQQPKTVPAWLVILGFAVVIAVIYMAIKRK